MKKKNPLEEHRAFYSSPIGSIEIIGTEDGLRAVGFTRRKPARAAFLQPCLNDAVEQIDEYFKGSRREFSLKLKLEGTEFQKAVWRELQKIPYGKTASYREVATSIGRKNAGRAVGQANHRNPFSIIVPCHRVIGSDGRLVGYGGGLWRKRWLLQHEQKWKDKQGEKKIPRCSGRD